MRQSAKRALLAALTGLALAGCTAQPLYAPAPSASATRSAALASVYVEEVDSRVGQQVRNNLIFLMNGGSAQPSAPEYTVALSVTSTAESAFVVQQTNKDGVPTSRTVNVSVSYQLLRASDKAPIGKRRVNASASYDVSLQEFANNRATRDAENRAAREAAEQLRGLIAADLARAGAL